MIKETEWAIGTLMSSFGGTANMNRLSPEVKFLQAGVSQIIVCPLMNVSLCFYFVVIGQTVYFMDEHFKVDVWIHFVGSRYSQV